jgi:predicted AAA+ superfamily ATPase
MGATRQNLPFFQLLITLSIRGAFGTIISGNCSLNTELSESTCSAIISALKNKISPTKIARIFNVSRATIYRMINQFQQY